MDKWCQFCKVKNISQNSLTLRKKNKCSDLISTAYKKTRNQTKQRVFIIYKFQSGTNIGLDMGNFIMLYLFCKNQTTP